MSALGACVLLCLFLSCGKPPTKPHVEYLQTVEVRNATMSYVDTGGKSKNTVVFLHGNPSSSYLWRNIYPKISSIARCFAPDLIGMGRSDKVPGLMYTFDDHFKYLSEWMDKVVKAEKITLVIHDWGSALGFHWANLNRDRVQAIIHMESFVGPLTEELSNREITNFFRGINSPAGEQMILQQNMFIEQFLPSAIIRNLTTEEMAEYRRPFLNPGEDRRTTLTWGRSIPIIGGGPNPVVQYSEAYNKWLSTTLNIPKLLILASQGVLSEIAERKSKNWPNQTEVKVQGNHFLQEDSPKEISDLIYCFLNLNVFTKHE